MKEEILNLNKEFKIYLENLKQQMISDLKDILTDKSVIYLFRNTKENIVAYYFEYEWDILDIVMWAVDKNNNVVNEALILPTNLKGETFVPLKILKGIYDFQENYKGEDMDEILEEYESEKYELFENWFFDCWKQTMAETEIKVGAYFSIHDTNYKTDLNTFEEVTDQQIEMKYK